MITRYLKLIALLGLLFVFAVRSAIAQSVKVLEISEEKRNANLLDNLRNYPDLEVLSISCLETLQSLPESVGKLYKLKELKIDNGNGCAMNPVLPENIGDLQSLEKLILYGAQDTRGVGKHKGPQPAERHEFPKSIAQLKNLKYLDLGRNGFDRIPPFVGEMSNLRELGFEWNIKLKEVPVFIGNLRELMTLRLNGNDLEDLPNFLNSLPKLSQITLGNNCKITQNEAKMKELKIRFSKITIDFEDEYDCQ